MIGLWGKILINAAFVCSILAGIGYLLYSRNDNNRYFRVSNWLFGLQGLFLVIAAGLLIYLILTHQFNYYYVYNYTSSDLQLKYLVSAFWGGQEGSFMLWIFFSTLIGLGLMKWTRKPYRGPVLFFLTLTQVFLLSMIAGFPFGDFTLGASPFRTIAEAMPNAPFIQANPDFVPADGRGLNDLLKSPWMVIHPPVLFFGFAMMTVPYCYAMAALWKKKYNEWIQPALPWTLGANIALLTAIFLGGYWAYVTLSFGGYWAWDPVENASLVPWLLGTAGIHTMVIQRKSSTSQKASIVFALLAYVAVIYETFLTRSGILEDASVHSFVDLGLYAQLVIFMLVVTGVCLAFFGWRYKDLPDQQRETKFLSREFFTFSGALVLFLFGLVITLGTSSPVIGRLFTESPTPPEISFYNDWTYPLAIIAAIMTVIGQFLFWKKQDAESLAQDLLPPVALTCIITLITIMVADIYDVYAMLFLFAGWFALIGNGFIMGRLLLKNPKLIGGSLTHVGFGVLLLGILASSLYSSSLLDQTTSRYNSAVEEGKMTDSEGFPVTQTVNFMQLKLNEPTVVNNKYLFTYEGYTLEDQARPGQQEYRIRVEPLDGSSGGVYLHPQVYPMSAAAPGGTVQWSVDPDVYTGWFSDIFLYVNGSSYVEQKNEQVAERKKAANQPAAATAVQDSSEIQEIKMTEGQTISLGGFDISLASFAQTSTRRLPDSTMIAVRARLNVQHKASGDSQTLRPLFAIYNEDGKSYSYSPPQQIQGYGVTVRFTNIDPASGEITLEVNGIDEKYQEEWVIIVAEEKPFISVVWMGTFLLMIGFSVSIFRHWGRERKKS